MISNWEGSTSKEPRRVSAYLKFSRIWYGCSTPFFFMARITFTNSSTVFGAGRPVFSSRSVRINNARRDGLDSQDGMP
ncbi:hypothetical protein D3C75_983700 [compost metagenome]